MHMLISSRKHAYIILTPSLKSDSYKVKLGFTGYTLFFLFLLKNIDCGYLLEPPRRDGSNEYPQTMFRAEILKKYQIFFYLKKNFFFGGKIFIIFEKACFRNGTFAVR